DRERGLEVQPGEQLLDVFRQHIAFQVEAVAGHSRSQRGVAIGVRNDGHGNDVAAYLGHGETDAVDGDRSLVDQVAIELGRDAHLHPPIFVAQLFNGQQLADTVDVALHDVAAA